MGKGTTRRLVWVAGLGLALTTNAAMAQYVPNMWNQQTIVQVAGTAESDDAAVTLANLDYYSEYYNEPAEPVAKSSAPLTVRPVGEESKLSASSADCESCDVSCYTCAPTRRCISGVEATFLSPDFNGVPGQIFNTDINAGNALTTFESSLADVENFYVGPRLWLGWQGPRWGVVSRFWNLSASENANDPLTLGVGGDTQGSFVENRFDAYTIDLEAVRSCCSRRGSKLDLSFGVRHAAFENDSYVAGTDIITGGGVSVLTSSVFTARQFDGTGITMGLAGRRAMSNCSNISLFWNARTSVLWGDYQGRTDALASINNGNIILAGASAEAETEEDMFIAEFQLGLQWDHALRCAPANAFFRTALEYQYWDANGISGSAVAIATDPGNDRAIAQGGFGGLQMDLIGFSIGTGFTW